MMGIEPLKRFTFKPRHRVVQPAFSHARRKATIQHLDFRVTLKKPRLRL